VHYNATVEGEATPFESSHGKEPYTFLLGGETVPGSWNEGLTGMCGGEMRELVVPPHHPGGGFGTRGSGRVPGGATVKYAIELVVLKGVGSNGIRVNDHFKVKDWLPDAHTCSCRVLVISMPKKSMKGTRSRARLVVLWPLC